MRSRQTGFTLVEIAIVLVIIGLLLGGVLKGQELINSAKVKSMVADFRTTSTLVYSYQDRYRSMPGDQTQAQLNAAFGAGAATAATAGTPNNGVIDGNWNDTGGSEAFVLWQHLRLSNLATGTTVIGDAAYLPRNADGGQIGVESGGAAPYIAGMRGAFYVCSDQILGRYVRQIDTTMDDGNANSGAVQAVPTGSGRGTAGTASANIVDSNRYIVCVAF
ncbi:MAG: prepilin-type N-terminal cleavage/methylation domain-containing protein [Betaproteobacteria bacterium]|nr:prepilin-type N-terminal cleavage/methylation domain-containing protein [Betaproteobacteria bacterium]